MNQVDRWMPLRLLDYMGQSWNAHRRSEPNGPLPVVLPVVLHHGERGWTAPTSLDRWAERVLIADSLGEMLG